MKRAGPIGKADDAPFVDGDPERGIEGDAVGSASWDRPSWEVHNAVVASGQTPDENDNTQLTKAIPKIAEQKGFLKKDRTETLEAAYYPAAKSATITGSDVSFVASERSHQSLTVTKNLTIKKPAVVPAAGTMILQLNMDGSGGHAIGWDAAYKVRGKMNTGANVKNICNLTFIGDDEIYVVIHAVPEA